MALLCGSSTCVKRVLVAPEQGELNSYMQKTFVHLKPGSEYLEKTVIAVVGAKIEGAYLTGTLGRQQVRVLLAGIASIQVHQFDAGKTLLASTSFIALSVLIVLIGSGVGQANVD